MTMPRFGFAYDSMGSLSASVLNLNHRCRYIRCNGIGLRWNRAGCLQYQMCRNLTKTPDGLLYAHTAPIDGRIHALHGADTISSTYNK